MESIGSNKDEISSVHHCQLQGISPWFGESPQPFSKINADFNDKLLCSYSGWTDRQTESPCTPKVFQSDHSQSAWLSYRFICHTGMVKGTDLSLFLQVQAPQPVPGD